MRGIWWMSSKAIAPEENCSLTLKLTLTLTQTLTITGEEFSSKAIVRISINDYIIWINKWWTRPGDVTKKILLQLELCCKVKREELLAGTDPGDEPGGTGPP